MKKQIIAYLTRVLVLWNHFPTPMTNIQDIRALLNRLHPVSIDKALIRMGPKGDGGYLLPDDLAGIPACFSPGVSYVSGFEKDCADLGMKVFLADKSVDGPAATHPLFQFTKKFIGATSADDFMTVDNWVANSGVEQNADLLLQIDVEGYEYEVFLALSDALMQRFRIIVVEFHELDQLWNRPFFKLASRAFDKILQTHACVHIHPNNCCGSLRKGGLEIPKVMEFSFLRRDRITLSSHRNVYPNPLDVENTANPALPLPSCWYQAE